MNAGNGLHIVQLEEDREAPSLIPGFAFAAAAAPAGGGGAVRARRSRLG